jgi:uncharacterized protein
MEDNKKVCCAEWKNHKCAHIAASILVILIAIFLIKGIFQGNDRGNKNADQNTIVVTGKGELTVKPDIAELSFSVTDENIDVSKASDNVNTKIAAIVAKLKADGMDEKDIQTTGYDIEPQYNYVNEPTPAGAIYYPSGKQILAGYNVTDSINIKIRDLTKAGSIVTDLGTLGATNMSGLTFTEDKYDDLVKQARDEAIADARTQAQDLAKALGVKLDKIVAYSEGNIYPVYNTAMSAAPMAVGGSVQAVLPTGQNTITSNVSITYEIK